MLPVKLKPRQSLNKAFLKVKPSRSDIEVFKKNLIRLIDQTNATETEEFHKNLVADFLKKTYYDPNHFINTKGRNDLVIHNGKDAKTTVGVIIEAKKPTNKSEMLRTDKLNVKALQELVLYYLRERITLKNLEIHYLIVTNISEWFIFDATVFEKHFAQNKKLVKQFEDFENKRLSGISTEFFYDEIARPFIDQLENSLEFTHFDLRDYEKPLKNNDKSDDTKLIALYKLLSPPHLLKLPFANDSNSLDKKFYSELLHIIGLTETKQGGKKVIERHKPGERNDGSLLENAVSKIDSLSIIMRLENPGQYGETLDERLFNVGLELAITWVNRILFLKLLEAQLIAYHKGDAAFAFLNFKKINNYDDLSDLFFGVLAKRYEDRTDENKVRFANVPYLNSSLFEPSFLEYKTIDISNLRDEKKLPILTNTVLKTENGRKRTGELNALEYFFAFLDAYDFSSEGTEAIQEDNKTLINASVLGLIFEKINGYKDGSFFTPGFITMYMCRETIRRAVVQKFNDAKGWNCVTLDDLYEKIDDRTEANRIVNSLKICDPAVGSGHFLVSALNELIAIKNDLKILQDRDGKRLKEYVFEVVNDELVVTDENGELFEYVPGSRESQRVQEALFHEKQTIIENCLFGVDINPNSVKICRLRLWIELLKNAFYKDADLTGFGNLQGLRTLETLPNIDINIKCGNSLISRFGLDADIKAALKKSKWSIDSYRMAVDAYRNAQSKEEKREMERLINDIKSDFRSEISKNDPKVRRLYRLSGELAVLTTQTGLFELAAKEKKIWNAKVKKLTTDTQQLETEIEEIKNNKIYENAFEWRFEFPEVLNDDGDFVGFDVVIGNPPYVFARENFTKEYKQYYYSNYKGIDYQVNLYVLFSELTLNILGVTGKYGLIVPNSLLMVSSTVKIRTLLFENAIITEIINFLGESFEGVGVETVSYFGERNSKETEIKIGIGENGKIRHSHTKSLSTVLASENLVLNVFANDITDNFLIKLNTDSQLLNDLVLIKSGLKAYEATKGIPKQSKEDVKNRIYDYEHKFDENTFPYLEGKDVNRYSLNAARSYLKYGENLAAPRSKEIFSSPKIILREITGNHPYSLIATYSEELFLFNMSNIAINARSDKGIALKYILALINCRLISYYFQVNTAKAVRKLFPKIILKDLRNFPIKDISIDNQKPFIDKVTQILDLKKADPAADTSALEAEIDQLVYELYGLTAEEIEIVENAVG